MEDHMPARKRDYFIPIALGAIILFGLLLLWPTIKASAQCGSQASSCKNCHETQAQDAVNNDGKAWHMEHQQIDACVNCHAGNPQSTDKTESHTGMVPWYSDVKAGCYTCHPNDYMALAQGYATTLGVQLGSGGGTPSTSSTQPTSPPSRPAATSEPAPAIVVNEPGVIDYARQYDETVLGKRTINWGNVIVMAMILGIAIGGGAFVYWNERRLRGLEGFFPRSKAAAKSAETAQIPIIEGYSAEVTALLPMIARLNPVGLHALKRILQDPEQANEMLHALSHLDLELVHRIQALDKDSQALLMALAGS
jgi:hypothetical protein